MTAPFSLRGALAYLACFALFALPPNLLLIDRMRHAPHTVDAKEKLARFAKDGRQYDLVFVGDSRAYCGFDPELLDPLLGTHSINLSYWAHWFPTQYPSFQRLVPLLAPNAIVVWSIGHQNFRAVDGAVNTTYPIGLANVPRYLRWGYATTQIEDNVASSLLDGIPAHAYRDRIRRGLDGVAARFVPRGGIAGGGQPLGEGAVSEVSPGAGALAHQSEFDSLRAALAHDPAIERVRPWVDGGEITSAEVSKVRGNYTRVEFDPGYFRARQAELARELHPTDAPFTASAEYWNTFAAALDLFQSRHVHLIVNEVEEAPYHYAGPDAERYRGFMRGVRRYVEGRGIPYVRVRWEDFDNADYFDYNHLNSRGIARFSPMLADSLRPRLR
jgi:hypothetical protein